MDSLPQIRNLLEMREISSAAKVSGGVKDEVNDEGTKAHRGGHSRAIPTGAEEREDGNSERVCGAEPDERGDHRSLAARGTKEVSTQRAGAHPAGHAAQASDPVAHFQRMGRAATRFPGDRPGGP